MLLYVNQRRPTAPPLAPNEVAGNSGTLLNEGVIGVNDQTPIGNATSLLNQVEIGTTDNSPTGLSATLLNTVEIGTEPAPNTPA